MRCADLQSSETTGLDISPAARFHQSTMYWQHPHLPWLTLFPRTSKANIGCTIGEAERTALARDWSDSFRALFQVTFEFSLLKRFFFLLQARINFFSLSICLAGSFFTMPVFLCMRQYIHGAFSSRWYWWKSRNTCNANPNFTWFTICTQRRRH